MTIFQVPEIERTCQHYLVKYVNFYQHDQYDIIAIFQLRFVQSSCLSLLHNRQLCRVPKAVQPLDQLKCIDHSNNNNVGYNNEGQLLQLNNYHREKKSKSPDKKQNKKKKRPLKCTTRFEQITKESSARVQTKNLFAHDLHTDTHTHIYIYMKTVHTLQYTRYGRSTKNYKIYLFSHTKIIKCDH